MESKGSENEARGANQGPILPSALRPIPYSLATQSCSNSTLIARERISLTSTLNDSGIPASMR